MPSHPDTLKVMWSNCEYITVTGQSGTVSLLIAKDQTSDVAPSPSEEEQCRISFQTGANGDSVLLLTGNISEADACCHGNSNVGLPVERPSPKSNRHHAVHTPTQYGVC